MLSVLFGVHGRTVEVNWTLSGVADYRNPRYTAELIGCGTSVNVLCTMQGYNAVFWRAVVVIVCLPFYLKELA